MSSQPASNPYFNEQQQTSVELDDELANVLKGRPPPYTPNSEPKIHGNNANGFMPQSVQTYSGGPMMETTATQPQAVIITPYHLESNIPKPALKFDMKSIRAGFLRKVFLLLTSMLAVVVAMIALFLYQPTCKTFVQNNAWAYFMSYLIFLVCFLVIAFWEKARRSYPGNYISLLVLTLSLGYMTATISSFYNVYVVFMAMAICTVSCFSIVVFTLQTKYDFLSWIGFLFLVIIILLVVGFIALLCSFVFYSSALVAVYAGVISLIFMLFFAIDVRIVTGKFSGNYEEYVAAAALLFVDIIRVFLYLLLFLAAAKK